MRGKLRSTLFSMRLAGVRRKGAHAGTGRSVPFALYAANDEQARRTRRRAQ